MIRHFGTKVRPNVRVGPINGRIRRNMDGLVMMTGAQKPAHPADINYDALGLTHKMTVPVKFVTGHWQPKPETSPNLPFEVERTLFDTMPVYTDYKAGGNKVITILRRCKGDIEVLRDEMEKVVGTQVIVKPGKLVVDGNYSKRLKTWLTGLGF